MDLKLILAKIDRAKQHVMSAQLYVHVGEDKQLSEVHLRIANDLLTDVSTAIRHPKPRVARPVEPTDPPR